MATSYFNIKKLRRQSKQHDPSAPATVTFPSEGPAKSPVLDEEDEKFLERLTAIAQESERPPPPLPDRTVVILDNAEKKVEKGAQEAVIADADTVSLPMSPPEATVEDGDKAEGKEKKRGKEGDGVKRRKSVMSYFNLAQSKFRSMTSKDADKEKEKNKKHKEKGKEKEKVSDKDREEAANSLHAAAESAKSSEQKEAEKEKEDLTQILDQLNLSAVNNRVFSFSKESQELLDKFKLVLKDLVNGVPTAYNDLEKLLTDSENQLKKMYGSLPPFLQNLVKSLPTKISAALAPEILAAQAEKPGFDAKQASAHASTSRSKSKKPKIPSLKTLVSAEGAVAAMLKSILNFLKLRFPAFVTGTNILMSLAIFILLFVFWYCHKRGRETRLEKERLAAEEADSAMASSASSFDGDGDSLLNEKPKGGSSKEKPEPPLVIHDHKEAPDRPRAQVKDMPSVTHLHNPVTVPLPESEGTTLLKEEPLKVPESK